MKIAGVSVNEKSLPLRKELIKQALKTKQYLYTKKEVAEGLINKEIDKSGLYRNISKGTEVSNKSTKSLSK